MSPLSKVHRQTRETEVDLELELDGRGQVEIDTGIPFLDHMLHLFAAHGYFDLKLKASGDLEVDQHHTVEDIGIVLGQLFAKALGDRRGINRAGYFVQTMDETLAVAAVDLGGRPYLVYKDQVRSRLVGDLQSELVEDFFEIGASGRLYERERVIETVVDRYERDDPGVLNEVEEFAVREIGAHLFIATYVLHQPDGHARRSSRRATVWTNATGHWQVVYHQGTIVEA